MILATTHESADFDCAAGLLGALLLHPGAEASFPGSKSAALRAFLEEDPAVLPERRARDVDLDAVDTLVVVDTLAADRIGRFRELVGRPGVRVLGYDHHPPAPGDLAGEIERRPVGAVATLFVERLRERGTPVTPAQATLLLLGIHEDTGGLLHAGTTPADHEAAAWLLRQGADLARAARVLARGLTPDQVALSHALLQEARTLRIHGREVLFAAVDAGHYVPDASVVLQGLAASDPSGRAVAVIGMGERVVLIARSRAEDFDAGALARRFGGGGHPAAASANLHPATLGEAREKVVEALRRALAPPLTAAELADPLRYTLRPDQRLDEAVAALNRYRVNALPVLEGGRVVGALTRQVADVALSHGMGSRRVADVAAGVPPIAAPEAGVEDLLALLSGGQRFVLVGRGPREATGIVTRTALLRRLHEDAAAQRAPVAEGESRESLTGLLERRLPAEVLDLLRAVGRAAAEKGGGAFLVGGTVRDLLLGAETRDVDVVVEGDACALAEELGRQSGARVRKHPAFGTAALTHPSGLRLDLATARTEHYRTPAALPEVAPGALRQDLFRRDFTINTLAVRLTPDGFGRLVDLFGGRRDLTEGTIRVLHGLSFIEDPTRAFRAVRFAVRLNFSLAPETEHLLKVARREGVFARLTPVRLRREIEALFSERRAVRVVRTLSQLRLLETVHPALKPTRRTWLRLERAEEALAWHRLLDSGERPAGWAVILSVLLEREDRAVRNGVLERLRPGAAARDLLRDGPERARGLAAALRGKPSPGTLARACRDESPETLLLAMALASREEVRRGIARYLSTLREVRPDVRGHDLLAAGIPRGPAVARGLAAALAAKLDREAGREEQLRAALAAARRHA